MKKLLLSLLFLGLSSTCSLAQSSGGFQGRDNLGNHIATMDILPDSSNTWDIGSTTLPFKDIHANNVMLGKNTTDGNNGNFSVIVDQSPSGSVGAISGNGLLAVGANTIIDNGSDVFVAGSNNKVTNGLSVGIMGAGNTISDASISHIIGRSNTITHDGVVALSDGRAISRTSTIDDQLIADFLNGYIMDGGSIVIESDLLPKTANAVSLGSLLFPFDELFIASNTIFIGTNQITVIGPDPDEILYNGQVIGSTVGDNLGDHIATELLTMSGFRISADGDDEGILVEADGDVEISDDLLPDANKANDVGSASLQMNEIHSTRFLGGDGVNTFTGDKLVQVGQDLISTGNTHILVGQLLTSDGANNALFGFNNSADGNNNFVANANSTILGSGDAAFGGADITGDNIFAVGLFANALGTNNIVMGRLSVSAAGVQQGVALGHRARVDHDQSVVISARWPAVFESIQTNEIALGARIVRVDGDIVPTVAIVSDIGSALLPFNDIYLNTNSVFLGTNQITAAGPGPDELLYNGQVIGSTTGDNLGDHTATQILNMAGFRISADGDDEGILVQANGDVQISHNLIPLTDDTFDLGSMSSQFDIGYINSMIGGDIMAVNVTNSYFSGKEFSEIDGVEHCLGIGRNVDFTNAIHCIAVSDNTIFENVVNSSAFGGVNSIRNAVGFSHILGRGVTITHKGVVALTDSDGLAEPVVSGADDQLIANFDNGYLLDGGNVRIEGNLLPDVTGGSDLGNSAVLFDDIFLSGTILMGTDVISVSGSLPEDVLYNGQSISDAGNDNLGNHVVEQDLIPDANMAYDLGSDTFRFDIAYLDDLSVGESVVSGGTHNVGIGNSNVVMTGNNSLGVGSNLDVSGTRGITVGLNNTNQAIQSMIMGRTHTISSAGNQSVIIGGIGGTVTHPGVVMFKDANGTMASTADNQFLTMFDGGYVIDGGDIKIESDLLPKTSNTVNLGSATLPFAELFVDTNSIFMGDNEITANSSDIDGLVYNGDPLAYAVIYNSDSSSGYTKTGASLETISNMTFSSVAPGDYEVIGSICFSADTAEDRWEIALYDDGVVYAGTQRGYVHKDSVEEDDATIYKVINVPATSTIDIRVERTVGAGDLVIAGRAMTLKPVNIKTF